MTQRRDGETEPKLQSDTQPFSIIREADVVQGLANLYGGDGTISARYFRFNGTPAPANFVIFDMPPGSSEGLHTHPLDGPTAYDEYYYVLEGEGEMTIAGTTFAIKTGDHIHTPLGVEHGVRNIQPDKNLRLFLTYIHR